MKTVEELKAQFEADEAKLRAQCDAQYYYGHLVGDLRKMWHRITNDDDPKGPIDAVVRKGEVACARTAIAFFGACRMRIESVDGDKVHITAPGYRNGPCGDY